MSRLELTAGIITERMGNTPDHPYLSPDYQNWLCQKGILERVPLNSPVWSELREMKLGLKQRKSLLAPDALFLILMGDEGRLVSLRRQAAILYGLDFLDVSSFEIQDVKQSLFALNSKLDKRIHTYGALFCGRGIGRGIGISALAIGPSEMRVLYTLWQDKGRVVSHGSLAHELYGCDGESERGSTRFLMWRIRKWRKELNGLDIRNVWRSGYMLVDEGSEKGREDNIGGKTG